MRHPGAPPVPACPSPPRGERTFSASVGRGAPRHGAGDGQYGGGDRLTGLRGEQGRAGRRVGAGQPRLLKPAAVNDQGEGWVIVDDLVDRGHTARFVRALLPRARFVCLYAKPEGRPFADKVIGDFEQQVWLKFPWEIGE